MAMHKDPSRKYRPFPPVALPHRRWPDGRITRPPIWCSVDLRDGNQALIEPMDLARKLRMFEQLVAIGFSEIEVGFPSASQTELDFVRALIEEQRVPEHVTIQVLTQAREPLIRRTFEALRGARRAILHFYHATAPVMRRVVFRMSRRDVLEQLAVVHARLIKEMAAERPETEWMFQYSPEMFSGTELEFARDVIDAVTEVWAPTPEHPCVINLPATVEHSTPNVFADMVEWTHDHLARRDAIVLSVHPHNDRGTGTAAAELALMAGADRVEGCLFGNGERTGNVDVATLALNMYTQGVHPELDFSDIDAIRRCVEFCNQLPVHPRHPYVGDLVHTSFSGSHQDAIRKAFAARREGDIWDMPYLPIDPKDLGRSYEAVIRVNSQSGKGGISYLLETEYGVCLPRRLQIELSGAVQAVTDGSGKEITPEEIWAIFRREYVEPETPYGYISHHLVEDQRDGAVELAVEILAHGRQRRVTGRGNGPIEAFVTSLVDIIAESIDVLSYHEHAIAAGAGADAAAYIELRIGGGRRLFGVGIDASILAASLKAILSALNRAARGQSGRGGASCREPRCSTMRARGGRDPLSGGFSQE